jgi:hypothetical protein
MAQKWRHMCSARPTKTRFISLSLTSTPPLWPLGNLVVGPANWHFSTWGGQIETLYTVSEFIIAITSQSNSKFIATYWYAAPLQAPSHDQVSCCALRARTWCACPASHPSPDPIPRGFGHSQAYNWSVLITRALDIENGPKNQYSGSVRESERRFLILVQSPILGFAPHPPDLEL